MIENRFSLRILKRFIYSKYSRLFELETLVIIVFLGLNVFVLSLFGSSKTDYLTTYRQLVALENMPPPPPPAELTQGEVKGEVLGVSYNPSTTSIMVGWNAASNLQAYVVQWALSSEWPNNRGGSGNLAASTLAYTISGLQSNTSYHVQVVAVHYQPPNFPYNLEVLGESDVWTTPSCTPTSPMGPSLSSPSDGVSFASGTTSVTLDWSDVTNWGNECSGTSDRLYAVYFGTSLNPPWYSWSSDSVETVSVSSGNTYYWKSSRTLWLRKQAEL